MKTKKQVEQILKMIESRDAFIVDGERIEDGNQKTIATIEPGDGPQWAAGRFGEEAMDYSGDEIAVEDDGNLFIEANDGKGGRERIGRIIPV